ncbi:MAG: APC family permease [Firmicutes bacterium]|nr:APC family permease [Bacillota bacterium]
MNERRSVLSQGLGRTDVIALGFGTMVGWGWIMMGASWVSGAGYLGALIAFLVGGGILLLIGLIYGELTAALPLAGGEFVFVYRAIGSKTAFLTGWIMALAYLSVAAWEGIALATAVNYLLPIPRVGPLWEIAGYEVYLSWALVGMIGAAALLVLNLIGSRTAILFQVMATMAIMAIVLILVLGGLVYGSRDNIGNVFTTGSGFSYVLLMVPAMLIGFDVIPQSAEEMNLEKRDIGRMIMVCIIISVVWYCLLILGVGLAAPEEVRSSGIIPVADVAAYAFRSQLFSDIMILGGILGILTTWNGFFLGASRLLFAMGRARLIPEVFGRTMGKNHVPVVAILAVGILCIATPLLGRNALIWLVSMSALCALFTYTMVAVAFVQLRRKEPRLERPFKLWNNAWIGALICLIAIVYTLFYIVSAVTQGEITAAYAMLIAWLMAGVFLYGLADRQRRVLTKAEAEYMVFGRTYPRRRGDHHA